MRSGRQARLAVLLAAVAGFVDAAGFLVLHEVFVAHMTGNTDQLGQGLGAGIGHVAPLIAAPATFVCSIALTTVLVELETRAGRRSPTAAALGLELVLLAAAMAYGGSVVHHGAVRGLGASFYAVLVLVVAAMGAQTATITTCGSRTIRTTYISGMLTRLAQELANLALGPRAGDGASYLADRLNLGGRRVSAWHALVYASLWGGFLAGAVLGAFAVVRWQLWALGFPLGALALVLALDLRRPIY